MPVPLSLPDDAVDALADALAERLALRFATEAPRDDGWLSAEEAASRIRAPRSRIYELAEAGKLAVVRDGRRLLVRSSELDRYLVEGPRTSA